MSAVTNALRDVAQRGTTYADLGKAIGASRGAAMQLCIRMRDEGLVVMSRSRGSAPVTVWLRELAPPDAESRINTVDTRDKTSRAFCEPVKKAPKNGPVLRAADAAVKTAGTRHVVLPPVVDTRLRVRLDTTYQSQLDASECRPWAREVVR